MPANSRHPNDSPLGKPSSYESPCDPALLFPIARQPKRNELGIGGTLPFYGLDFWNAYEVSWLNPRGKPQIAIANIAVPADSPNIIESKSFKLYLNSFNQTRLAGPDALLKLMRADLSNGFGAQIDIALTTPESFGKLKFTEPEGIQLDRLDIEVDQYTLNPAQLTADELGPPVEETLASNLLKSNCPVTGQPDWASIQIQYVGPQIDQACLLRYLIGFRMHNDFHEQCVERIFMDILRHCKPQKLAVFARYTRRGGLDINPWRSNFTTGKAPSMSRNARQ